MLSRSLSADVFQPCDSSVVEYVRNGGTLRTFIILDFRRIALCVWFRTAVRDNLCGIGVLWYPVWDRGEKISYISVLRFDRWLEQVPYAAMNCGVDMVQIPYPYLGHGVAYYYILTRQ